MLAGYVMKMSTPTMICYVQIDETICDAGLGFGDTSVVLEMIFLGHFTYLTPRRMLRQPTSIRYYWNHLQRGERA